MVDVALTGLHEKLSHELFTQGQGVVLSGPPCYDGSQQLQRNMQRAYLSPGLLTLLLDKNILQKYFVLLFLAGRVALARLKKNKKTN